MLLAVTSRVLPHVLHPVLVRASNYIRGASVAKKKVQTETAAQEEIMICPCQSKGSAALHSTLLCYFGSGVPSKAKAESHKESDESAKAAIEV